MKEGPPRSRTASITRLLMLVLSMASTLMPWFPEMPDSTLDSSWQFAMNEAVARHFVIGKDVIFTFGPYASVYTHAYHPALFALTLFATGYLAFLYVVCLVTLTETISIVHLAVVCLLFAGCCHAPDAVLYAYPLMVGMIVVSTATPTGSSANARLALLFSGFGLMVLVKGSFVPLCLAVMALCAIALVIRHRVVTLVAATSSAFIAMIFFWSLAGQPLSELPTYFRTLLPTIAGYTDAMGLLGPRREIVEYLLGAAASLLIVWRGAGDQRTRLLLVGLFTVFLFLALKGGTVRHDGHVVITSAAALLLGAVLISARFPSRYSFAVVLSGAAFFVSTNAFWAALQGTSASRIYEPYRGLVVALINDATDLGWRQRLFVDATTRIKEEHPVAANVSDIYPASQAAVIAAAGPWKPRPIFQSYSAYTASLLNANRDHLLGNDSPDRIDFAVMPIDGRLPSLEDGASWPVLLTNYRIVETRKDSLTLERTATPAYHDTAVFGTTSAQLGATVAVPASPGLIWARMAIRQSLLGKMMSFFHKAPQLEIAIRLANGSEHVYRLIAGMTQTDFLLSPLVDNTQDFNSLYMATDTPVSRSVVSFQVRTLGPSLGSWHSDYEVEFRRL